MTYRLPYYLTDTSILPWGQGQLRVRPRLDTKRVSISEMRRICQSDYIIHHTTSCCHCGSDPHPYWITDCTIMMRWDCRPVPGIWTTLQILCTSSGPKRPHVLVPSLERAAYIWQINSGMPLQCKRTKTNLI